MPTASMTNAHALIVGIGNYQHIRKLGSSTLKDARDVHAILTEPAIGGYDARDARLLLDGDATLAGLRGALAHLRDCTDPDSTVYVYMSCHGAQVVSGPDAGEYLLPVDVRVRDDDLRRLAAKTAIPAEELSEWLRALPARKVLMVLDCCHSGGLGEARDAIVPDVTAGLSEATYEKLASGRGRAILASSRDSESSWVLPGDANGLFTKHLLAAFRGGAGSKDGYLRLFDLFEYVQPRVTAEEPRQHPLLKLKIEENFPVALRLGGEKGGITESAEGFRHDVYISWTRDGLASDWVRNTLLPRFRAAGLRVAMTGVVEEPGVALVVGLARAVEQSRRTIMVLSEGYLASQLAEFENTLAQQLSIEERRARLLPVVVDETLVDAQGYVRDPVALRLRMLTPLVLTDPLFGQDNLDRLVRTLAQPLPL